MNDKSSLSYKIGRAVKSPSRILPYFRRVLRNRRLKHDSKNYLEFYGKVVDDMSSSESPDRAVGATSTATWQEVGKLQFDFLTTHGLKPEHRLLDIGCGNLRGGWRLIQFLNESNYVGIDISPKILTAALKTIREQRLQDKRPYLYFVDSCDYSFLPEDSIDFVHAHSVFSHLPIPLIEDCLAGARRVLKTGGHFDFTYLPSETRAYSFCEEDYYYPGEPLLEIARKCGFQARAMQDWVYPQKKIRATK